LKEKPLGLLESPVAEGDRIGGLDLESDLGCSRGEEIDASASDAAWDREEVEREDCGA